MKTSKTKDFARTIEKKRTSVSQMVRMSLISIFLITPLAQATPSGLTYQGRLVKNNLPVESSAVTLTVKVTSPGANECVLFEETHSLNMSNSDGIFSIKIGGGTRTAEDEALSLVQVFSNTGIVVPGLICGGGATSYTSLQTDSRNIYVTFNDGVDTVAFSSPYVIQSVPYALEAERLAGKSASEFLQTSVDTTQSKVNAIMAATPYAELLALIGGTSTQYFTPASGISTNGTGTFSQNFTGTGTASSLVANSVTTSPVQSITANGLTSGSLLSLSSNSTAAAAGNKGLDISISGANSSASITRTGLSSVVTSTGTTSTNVGGYFSASGAANNYGLIVANGNVGIGTTTPLYKTDIELNGIGSSLLGDVATIALQARNTTAATSGAISQNSPVLNLSGNYWDGSASQPMNAWMQLGDNGVGTNANFTIRMKRGAGATTQILNIDSNGQFGSALRFASWDARTNVNLGLRLSNDAVATATYNQNSPTTQYYSHGWKTGGTPGSQAMNFSVINSPENGVTNPVGVHKAVFGTNSITPSIANELFRYEWGDRLGVVFNRNNLAGYTSSFFGNVGVGTTLPTAALHLKAGTAATGGAPLKFTSGPVNTTPEIGAFEFLTDTLYFTITSGGNRKQVVLSESSLPQDRIPFVNNGRLTHDADLTFLTDTLTATKLVSPTSVSTPSIVTAAGPLSIIPTSGSNLNVNLSTTGDFAVNTNQLYVDTSAGNVGIGTITPSVPLEVNGDVKATAFLYTSDRRLKKDIEPIESPLEKLMALEGVQFSWVKSGERTMGFIAQDVERVIPEVVKTDKISTMKSVEYGNLMALTIEAMKSFFQREEQTNHELRSRLDSLERQNEELAALIKQQQDQLNNLKLRGPAHVEDRSR